MAFSQHGALWVGFFNASFDKLSIRLYRAVFTNFYCCLLLAKCSGNHLVDL